MYVDEKTHKKIMKELAKKNFIVSNVMWREKPINIAIFYSKGYTR